MEFSGQGHYRSIDMEHSLSLDQMLSVTEQIARLHAFALKVGFSSIYASTQLFRTQRCGKAVLKV